MRNYFTLDGVDSRDFGVYISGQGTFSAPSREYNLIPVPGRNGDLVGPEKRFANSVLTYPAFIYTNFDANIKAFRNFLLSLVGYHDLVDSYHPNEIRKVLFQGPFEPKVTTRNDAGSFDIEFICKPQRFLASGQEVITFEAGGGTTETYTGELVTFSNTTGESITGLTTDFAPVQDLNGYASPWPPGGNTNLLDFSALTLSKVSISGTADNFTLTGTDVSYNRAEYDCSSLSDGVYYVSARAERSAATGNNAFLTAQYMLNGTTYNSGAISNTKQYNSSGVSDTVDAVLQFPEGSTNRKLFFYLNNNSTGGTGVTTTITGARICAAQNVPYSPYSNICPISGKSKAFVETAGKNLLDMTVYTGGTYNPAVGTTFNLSEATTQFTKSADGKTFTVETSATWRYFTVVMPIPKGVSLWRKFGFSSTGQAGLSFGYLTKDFKVRYNFNSTQTPTTINNDMNPTEDDAYFYIVFSNRGTASATLTVTEPQVEIGTSASAYEEFAGANNLIDFGSTYYDGTLDVLTGVLTVKNELVDLSSFTWNVDSAAISRMGTRVTRFTSGDGWDGDWHDIKCNAFKVADPGTAWASVDYYSFNNIRQNYYNFNVKVEPSRFADATAFKTWLGDIDGNGTHAVVAIPMAEPTTVQLTAAQVQTLVGENTVWADTGNVTVEVLVPIPPTVENPTLFDAQPLLRVYGTGTLGVGSQQITITQADVYTDIDCEMMDCYKGTANKNPYVQLTDHNFPVFKPGVTNLSLGVGITKVEITPRWWTV